jgi:hypothetical protein
MYYKYNRVHIQASKAPKYKITTIVEQVLEAINK